MKDAFKYTFLIRTLIVSVAVHLLYTNANLLLVSATGKPIGFIIIFALSYSIMTALLLELYPRITAIVFVALLDGAGVFIEKSPHELNIQLLTAIYFAVYTFYIILVVGLISKMRKQVDNTILDLHAEIENQKQQLFAAKNELLQLTETANKLQTTADVKTETEIRLRQQIQELQSTADKLTEVSAMVETNWARAKQLGNDDREKVLLSTLKKNLETQPVLNGFKK